MTRSFQFHTFGRRPSTLGGWVTVILGVLIVGGVLAAAIVLGAALLMAGLAVSAVGALGWWLRQQLRGGAGLGEIGYAEAPKRVAEVKMIGVDEILVEKPERRG